MTAQRLFWLAAVVLALGVVAVATPSSPLYLPHYLNSGPRFEGRSLNQWLRVLHGDDEPAKRRAIFAMGAMGAAAREAVPTLAKLMVEDPNREIRNEAALALSKMDPASGEAVAELGQALKDPEPFVRMNATLALFRLKKAAVPTVPVLIEELKKDENHTNLNTFTFTLQEITALALGRASAGTADAVPALLEMLQKAGTNSLRVAIVRALGDIGPEAKDAIPALRKLHASRNPDLREAVEEALRSIGAEVPPPAKVEKAAADADHFELPEPERAYIWDIEHHGNLLVKHGFGALAAALTQADADQLGRLLADDFVGADLRDPQRLGAPPGFVQVERLQSAGGASTPLDRDGFVARLLELRRVFTAAPPKVKFALMNLGPKVRGQLDGLWVGTTLLRLFGESSKGAPAEMTAVLRYEIPRPTEETLSGSGWLRGASVLQVLRAQAPKYLFAEVAQKRGLDVAGLHDNWIASRFSVTTGGVYVCDFDRDGILDVLITDINGTTLYRGLSGGKFEDVTSRVGLPRQPLGNTVAAWIDIDGDGWDDLILSGAVFRNDGGQRFIDVTERCMLKMPRDAGNIIVADYDRDGKLDLYVTRTGTPGTQSWLDDRSSDPNGNYLFRNKGNWEFENVTRAAGASGGRRSTFTAAWLDADNDGWPDLHVINEFGDGVLLINNRDGTFREQRLADRPADYGSMGLAVGDIDNDGNIDIFCNNMFSKAGTRVIANLAPDAFPPNIMEKMRRFVAGSQLHLNKGGLKFDQAGIRMQINGIGWSYGACLADLDNDGFLDIYATAGYISKSRDTPDG